MKKYLVALVDRENHALTVEANGIAFERGTYRFKKGDETVAYVHEDRVLYIMKIEE